MAFSYWQEVLVNLRKIIRATDLHSKRLIKECGLTIPQIMVLRAIEELGNVTVRRISDEVSLSQATVTTILNRLEQRHLIARSRSESDKRVVHARLTDEGSRVLKEAPPLLHETFIERFDALEDWEKTQTLAVLQRVAAMMDADNLDASPLLDVQAVPESLRDEIPR